MTSVAEEAGASSITAGARATLDFVPHVDAALVVLGADLPITSEEMAPGHRGGAPGRRPGLRDEQGGPSERDRAGQGCRREPRPAGQRAREQQPAAEERAVRRGSCALSVDGPPRSKALRFVVLLGFVSLFADMAYEGAHGINGQFLGRLGASATVVGAVAGLGELAAYGLRFLSGRWADRTRAYWPITIFGYCVNLLAVPAMALANHWLVAAGLILLERAGKAVRTPARDAMLSHGAHQVGQGWAFGLHEALDETGAALGPLVAAGVLLVKGEFHLAYAALLAPALLALGLLLFARKTYARPSELEPVAPGAPIAGEGRRFWIFLVAGALVGAGFADFSLVAYHLTRSALFAVAVIPGLYALANGLNAGGALLLGRAFDEKGPVVLAIAIVPPVASTPCLFLGSAPIVVVGIVLWAIGVTVQQSLFKSMLARIVPSDRRAIGFGTFDGAWGVASFGGGLLLGALYDLGVGWLVLASVVLQLLAIPLVVAVTRTRPEEVS